MFAFGSGGENYRTSMDTIERIEELKREIVKQKLLIESEEAKIEKVKMFCPTDTFMKRTERNT